MCTLTCTGRLGADAEETNVGDNKVTRFSVAVETGFGNNKKTLWVGCNYWRDGKNLIPYLKKGVLIEVAGEMSLNESTKTGKSYVNLNVDRLKLHQSSQSETSASSEASSSPAVSPTAEPAHAIPSSVDDMPF